MLLDDSLRGAELVARFEGPLVDVGSGGGAPGIPLAHAAARAARSCCSRPSGASARSCEQWAPPNARVVWGRAEEQATDWAGVAVAKALAHAADRGRVVPAARARGRRGRALGRPDAPSRERVAAVAARLAARARTTRRAASLVLRKTRPDAGGLPAPRRASARKRPLA